MRPYTAYAVPQPHIITSGKEQLIQLIDTLLQSGVPEHDLNDLFQVLGCEIYRSERDDLNPDFNDRPDN